METKGGSGGGGGGVADAADPAHHQQAVASQCYKNFKLFLRNSGGWRSILRIFCCEIVVLAKFWLFGEIFQYRH